jgi:hypothetical protein
MTYISPNQPLDLTPGNFAALRDNLFAGAVQHKR